MFLVYLLRRWSKRIMWKESYNLPVLVDGQFIETAEGLIEESKLETRHTRNLTPAGFSYTKEYFYQGRLVRQDSTQDVIHGLTIAAKTEQEP